MADLHLQLKKVIEMHKAAFWAENQNRHVPLKEIELRWNIEASQYWESIRKPVQTQPTQPSEDTQWTVPQTMTENTLMPKNSAGHDVPLTNGIDTTPFSAAPSTSSQPMAKKRSSHSGHCGAFSNSAPATTPLAPLVSSRQSAKDEPFHAFRNPSVSDRPAKIRKIASPPIQIPDQSPYVTEHDPAAWVKAMQPNLSPAYSLHMRPRRASYQRQSPISPLSRSPASTSDGVASTIATSASVGMSREDSLGHNSMFDHMQMLRVDSRKSVAMPNSEHNPDSSTGYHDFAFPSSSNPISDAPPFDFSMSVSHAQGADDVSLSPSFPPVTSNLQPLVVEEDSSMLRSVSSQSSESSSKSRVLRRCEEQAALSARPIASKDSSEWMSRQSSSSSVLSCDMTRQLSADGKKVSIPRSKYVRPQHNKIKCDYCNIKPEGFRGPHELRRHIDNKHASLTHKVWVCKDKSPDQQFLSKCKHCLEGKRYHAYYNAIAHLRRIHFNPKAKGKKGNPSSKPRGGDGGGTNPPMAQLKLWIEELNEPVNNQPFANDESMDRLLDDSQDYSIYCDAQLTHDDQIDEGNVSSNDDIAHNETMNPQQQDNWYEDTVFNFSPHDTSAPFMAFNNNDYSLSNFPPDTADSGINFSPSHVPAEASPAQPFPDGSAIDKTLPASAPHTQLWENIGSADMSFTLDMSDPQDQFDQSLFDNSEL